MRNFDRTYRFWTYRMRTVVLKCRMESNARARERVTLFQSMQTARMPCLVTNRDWRFELHNKQPPKDDAT